MKKYCLIISLLLSFPIASQAGEVEVVFADFVKQGKTWHASVTLKHDDSGWDHYANSWQVVDEDGKLLGERVLFHPHEHEQPFTRSLSQIQSPEGSNIIYVEGRDSVHGLSKHRVRVDLSTSEGDRYKVKQ